MIQKVRRRSPGRFYSGHQSPLI